MNALPISIVQALMGAPGAGRGQMLSGAKGGIGVERALTSVAAQTGRSIPQGSGFLSLLQQALPQSSGNAGTATTATAVSFLGSLSDVLPKGVIESLSSGESTASDGGWLASLREFLPKILDWLSSLSASGSEGSSTSLDSLMAKLKGLKGANAETTDSGKSDGLNAIVASIVQSLAAGVQAQPNAPSNSGEIPSTDSTSETVLPAPTRPASGSFAQVAEFLRRLDYVLHLIQSGLSSVSGEPGSVVVADSDKTTESLDPLRTLPTGCIPPPKTDGAESKAIQTLGNVLSAGAAAANENSGQTVPIALADRIYYSANALPGENAEALEAGRVRLVSLPAEVGEDPVAALQALMERIRAWRQGQGADTKGTQPGASADVALSPGIDLPRAVPAAHFRVMDSAQTPRVDSNEMIESVRQAQAAITDMVDRMKGDVSLDSRNMRAVIHLDPPSLGRLHIRLAIEDGQGVQARFDSDQSGTMNFLRQNQEDLRQELARQGFEEGRIRLDFGPGGEFAETLDSSSAAA